MYAEDTQKWVFEFGGGLNAIAMTDYNNSVDTSTSQMIAIGAVPNLNKLESCGFANGNIISVFYSDPIGLW